VRDERETVSIRDWDKLQQAVQSGMTPTEAMQSVREELQPNGKHVDESRAVQEQIIVLPIRVQIALLSIAVAVWVAVGVWVYSVLR